MRRLIEDEAGLALPLAIGVMVIVGVMGAGLLTFVVTDLRFVAEVNRGQRAFEMADAGVKAAKMQLVTNSNATNYNGTNDWSDADGKRLLMDGNVADVKIEANAPTAGSFRVTSTGSAPADGTGARRKVEAVFRVSPTVGFNAPPVFFTRTDLTISGSSSLQTSAFALGNIDASGAASLSSADDLAFGRWAETGGSGPYPNAVGSFPNSYNRTPRDSQVVGVGAQGQLSLDGAARSNLAPGTRSFGGSYNLSGAGVNCPGCAKVVPDYGASNLLESQKIAFPFEIPSTSDDAILMNALRSRALQLENENPGRTYYYDSKPGNGQPDGPRTSDFAFNFPNPDWPTGSAYDTVVFFEFPATESARTVSWNVPKTNVSCSDTNRKGIIVVNNGNFNLPDNSSGFNGGVFVRGTPPARGNFTSSGSPCMNGYVNTTGKITLSGNVTFQDVPQINNLPSITGGSSAANMEGWRELYE